MNVPSQDPEGDFVDEGAYVVYPADRLTGAAQITFPASYTQPSDAQGPVIVAKVPSNISTAGEHNVPTPLHFQYVTGAMRFTVSDVPAIATGFEISSTKTLCGIYTLGEDANHIPTITNTSDLGKTVTIGKVCVQPSEEGFTGARTIVIPIPTVGSSNTDSSKDQTITFSVKYSSTVLKTASVNRIAARSKVITRKTFASMAALEVAPTVYLKSDMTDWSEKLVEKAEWASMSKSSLTYSISLGALGDSEYNNLKECYKVYVEYDNDVLVKMGPSTNDATGLTNSYSVQASNANRIPGYGTYTFSYNNTTGAMTATKIATRLPLYVTTSSWSSGARTLDSSHQLTWLNDKWAFKILETNGDFKIYYNDYDSSEHGGSSNYIKSTETKLGTMGDYKCYILLVNADTKYYFLSYLGETGSESNKVYILGDFSGSNGWNTTEMTHIAHRAFGYSFKPTDSDGWFFRFKVGNTDWGTTGTSDFSSQTLYNTTGVSWAGDGHDNNYWLPASSYNKNQYFILHTNPGRRLYIQLD